MSADQDLTKAQWRRRALKAEAELESLRMINRFNSDLVVTEARGRAHQSVILKEIAELLKEAGCEV